MRPARGIRPDVDSLILLATSLALVALLVESSGIDAALLTASAWIAVIPMLAVGLGATARNRNMRCLHMAVFAVVLGSTGMLVGARLDFGRFGLAALADWCSALPPLALDTIVSRVAPAPWTYLGMLAGCNLGMLLSIATQRQVAAPDSTLLIRMACCNAGMAVGMVVAEAALSASLSGLAGVSAPLRIFIVMLAGMTAGMWGGWWIAELALRGRNCSTPLAALRRTQGLRS